MSEDISYEEHVLKNNQRLISIRQSLSESVTFNSACSELTQWCSDQRAFSACFEDSLLSALQTAVENGTKDGFDFPLAHQLITTCFSHRKLLSKASANRINRWYEQFRRLKKSGSKRKKKLEEQSTIGPLQEGMEHIVVTDSGTMWPQGGQLAGPSPMQSPGYGQNPAQMMQMSYPAGMQPSPYPMDPAGARPYPMQGDMYDQNAMQMQQQRYMMMQQQQQQQMMQQQQQARSRRNPAGATAAQSMSMDPMYQAVPMGVNSVPGQTQPLMRVPSQPGLPSPAYPGAPGMPRSGMMPMTSPGYMQSNPQMIRAGPPMLYSQMQQSVQQHQVALCPNPRAPTGDARNFPGEMPTVLIPRETILSPFCLEHNATTSSFMFNISPELMQNMTMPAFEIQLKCVHKDDAKQATQWPTNPTTHEISVQICVNGHPVHLPAVNRSAFIKQIVQPGQNKIEFTVNQCVCSHCFLMRVVVRQPLNLVVQDTFNKNNQKGFSLESFKSKLLQMVPPAGLRIPLVCLRTQRRMAIPARGARCRHANCFDLEPFLMMQLENSQLECPICQTVFSMEELEIDLFIGNILRETSPLRPQPVEFLLESGGTWQPCNALETAMLTNNDNNNGSRKRAPTDETGVNGPVHPMKRIKSEPFPQMMKTESTEQSFSPFPTASSVPNTAPIGQSPASLLSPFAANTSPMKTVSSPSAARFVGGPGTPLTPGGGSAQNPAAAQQEQAQLHGNSPPQTQIQQHGSVETPSLTGSAPYTPASQSNGVSTVINSSEAPPFSNIQNLSAASLDIDVVDGLIPTNIMSADDIRKYLYDGDLASLDPMKDGKKNSDFSWNNDSWDDIKSLIADGKI